MMLAGRQQGDELLAKLRELLYLPSPTTATPPAVKVVESSDGRRRRRRGSKRGRDDGKTNNGQQDDDEPAAARLQSCKTKRTKQQQKSRRCLVTSVPDFDGYQWRKYGQKQIEGAMYARSYYRCTRSAEQGCPAKRTVQRNDAATYTVVYMGEHTCTANDLEEAPPVILETAAAVIPDSTAKHQRFSSSYDIDDDTIITTSSTASAAGSCSTTASATGIESPVISSDITCWSDNYVDDDYSWVQEMEDLISGPIRSPLHVPTAADACWTIDHDHFLMMMQVVAANNDLARL